MDGALKSWITAYLSVRAPTAHDLAEDMLQEVRLALLEPSFTFPSDMSPTAGDLRRYLRKVVLNRLTDLLRREKALAKKRCGACIYFSPRGTCSKPTGRSPAGDPAANPWYEKKLDPHTNPDSLDPPCREFFWRYRAETLNSASVGPEASQGKDAKAQERRETQEALLDALALLFTRGPEGRRCAYLLQQHYMNGRPAGALAEELGTSERTVRRLLKAGLKDLGEILREKFHLEAEDLL